MSSIVDLPNDQTASLRDDTELTNREVRRIRNAAMVGAGVVSKLKGLGQSDDSPESWTVLAELPETELDKVDLFQRVCVLTRLESWTLDRPLPVTDDEVDDLPRSIYVPLVTAATDIKWSEDFSAEAAGDPKAGTARSGSSKQRSKAQRS